MGPLGPMGLGPIIMFDNVMGPMGPMGLGPIQVLGSGAALFFFFPRKIRLFIDLGNIL